MEVIYAIGIGTLLVAAFALLLWCGGALVYREGSDAGGRENKSA
jgi:hypothetical protein